MGAQSLSNATQAVIQTECQKCAFNRGQFRALPGGLKSMDRREVLKASLAGAASMGISSNRSYAEKNDAVDEAAKAGAPLADTPLVALCDYEAAARRKLS